MTPGETSYMSNCSAKVILPDLPSSVAGLYVRFFPLPESYMRHSPELYLHPCKRWRRYASAYKLGQTTQPPASVRNSTGLPARRVPGLRSTAGTLVLHCCWLVHGLGLYTASNSRFECPASASLRLSANTSVPAPRRWPARYRDPAIAKGRMLPACPGC